MIQPAPSVERLVSYLERDLTPAEAAEIEAHIERSEVGRAMLEQLRGLVAGVGRSNWRWEQTDLVDGIWHKIDSDTRRWRPARRDQRTRYRVAALAAAGLLAAALGGAVLALLFPRSGFWTREPDSEQIRVKSNDVAAASPDRWVGIQVFRLRGERDVARVSGSIRRDDGLLFAYTNLGPDPYPYLLIFGVDGTGTVHWYYPAFLRRGTNPSAIRIEPGRASVELREVIQHALEPGALTLYAVFARTQLKVLQVEAAIRDAAQGGLRLIDGRRLPLEDTAQHVVKAWVER